MLILFVFHLFITAICLLTGGVLYALLDPRNKNGASRPTIFYPFSGLIGITLISQILVLFTPLGKLAAILVLSVVLLLNFLLRKKTVPLYKNILARCRSLSRMQGIAIGACWLMVLIINSGPTMMDDTESYHIQMVKWINEYGSVPGIVNLHERFGFNSSWFTSIAYFFSAGNWISSYTALNAIISVWLIAFLIAKIGPARKPASTNTGFSIPLFFVLILAILCWPMIRGNAATANYDFISAAIIATLFISAVSSEKKEDIPHLEWIIWPVYLFTVRIINYPLLLLSLFSIVQLLKKKEWQFTSIAILASACLLIPFLARNVIVSGYPFYPSTSFDFFQVDWKTDPKIITELVDYIKYYNRVNVMYLDLDVTRQLGFPEWIPKWFRYLFRYDKPFVITAFTGFLLHLLWFRRSLRVYNSALNYFVLVLLLHILSWFFVAPDPRFVWGSLICGAVLLFQMPVKLNQLLSDKIRPSFLLATFSLLVISYSGMKFIKQGYYQYSIKALQLPKPPVREIMVDSVMVRMPEKILGNWNPRCYGTDLPCLYIVRPGLRMRGKTMQSGFRLEK